MNNMANMANMSVMGGGPVGGGPMPMMGNGAMPPQGQPRPPMPNDSGRSLDSNRTLLNTYIYEYFVRYGMYDCAREIYKADPAINVKKDSPNGRRDETGIFLGNGLGDDPMDTDTKDGLDQKRPDDLPAPNVPTPVPESCFLYEWFCLFWDMFNSQKGKGQSGQVNQYVQHTQEQSRMRQQNQQNMLRQIRPEFTGQHQYPPHMMRGMPNGAMQNMKAQNLQRAAMANNQNPQTMQMLQQQKAAAGQMQRNPSDMDGNGARPASPGSTDNAPSPSKRPRLDGAPFNPNQNVMMPNGRPAQGMPGQQVGNGSEAARALLLQNHINPNSLNPDQLQNFVAATPLAQAKSIATYAANLQQHHGNQMPNKPMATAGGPQPQGSPMVPQGPEIAQFYNPGDMASNNMRPGGPGNGQATGGSNHALQDYQMQLMLLEQQNKKRLMMARQETDVGGGGMPRADGQNGPGGGPGGPPNPQFAPGQSPPGGRSGASPNPSEQMKRQQQMTNAANMGGSPLPDGPQSRSSPNSMNFMGGQMDPNNGGQHFFAGQMNGMRPPSSHPGPQFNGNMNQAQMIQAQRVAQQAVQGGPGAGMQWQGGPNGQGPQPQVQGTPQQRSMPPPPSAPQAAVVAANSRNTTSSPQTSNAAPPTPQQGNKAAPKKKETGKAKSKAAPKKAANANSNAAATPAPDPEPSQDNQAPATPITPVGPPNFKNQNVSAHVANGQPPAPVPPPQAAPVPPPQQHQEDPTFMDMGSTFNIEFANPLTSDNVLNDFDFDSFLHDSNGGEDNFDFNAGSFMEGGEIGAE